MFLLCCIIYWDYIWVPAIFRPSRVYGSALVVKIISLNSENVSEKCVNAFLEEIWWWSWLLRDSGSRGQGRAAPGNGHNGRHCVSHTVTHYDIITFQQVFIKLQWPENMNSTKNIQSHTQMVATVFPTLHWTAIDRTKNAEHYFSNYSELRNMN